MSNKRNIAELMVGTVIALCLFGQLGAQGAEVFFTQGTTTEVDGEDVYLWGTSENWVDDTGAALGSLPSSSDDVRINSATGTDRAVVDQDTAVVGELFLGQDSSEGAGPGELDILTGATVDHSEKLYMGLKGDGTSSINVRGGTYTNSVGTSDVRIGMASFDGGDTPGGELNLYSGSVDSSMSIGVYDNGRGEVNIHGGQFGSSSSTVINGGSHAGPWSDNVGVFNVAGSGATSIDIKYFYPGGKDDNTTQGTIKFGIDDGGVTPIHINDDGGLRFRDNSYLDVGFLDNSDRQGDWDVLTWSSSGVELEHLSKLQFADTVDTDIWSFQFDETDNKLTVSAVPEPSSLALLALGGLLLMKRRRRA